MNHLSAKTILITKVTELIANEYKLTIDEARDTLYSSGFVDVIEDDESGLYGQSPLYAFSIFKNSYYKDPGKR